jgi:glycine/D-amino acid oxidase-like deaminating enzyme
MAQIPGKPESCWVANLAETSFPASAGEHECDVVIVGAGIVGLTTALELLENGKSVAVLEARRIGRQVTGRSTAKITTQHALIYSHLIKSLGRELAQTYADANREGCERIGGWIRELGSTATTRASRLSLMPLILPGRAQSRMKRRQRGASGLLRWYMTRRPCRLRRRERWNSRIRRNSIRPNTWSDWRRLSTGSAERSSNGAGQPSSIATMARGGSRPAQERCGPVNW